MIYLPWRREPHPKALGRVPGGDPSRLEKHPLTASPILAGDAETRVKLALPRRYRAAMDQGEEGACVGFAWSWAMSIMTRKLFEPFWLYHEAQLVDPWEGEDYSGTSVDAGGAVLLDKGHRKVRRPRVVAEVGEPDVRWGVQRYYWCRTVDEVRAAIRAGFPVVLGVDWYTGFDRPETRPNGFWLPEESNWGHKRGGHAICCFGADDSLECVWLVNSWGLAYPIVKLSYAALGRLLDNGGDAAVGIPHAVA